MNVFKIYDHDCEVCKHMSRHDRSTFESMPGTRYYEASLEELSDPASSKQPLTYARLYRLVEENALNPDYTIDLPVYLVIGDKGEYLTFLKGALTIEELRNGVKPYLVDHGTPEDL